MRSLLIACLLLAGCSATAGGPAAGCHGPRRPANAGAGPPPAENATTAPSPPSAAGGCGAGR